MTDMLHDFLWFIDQFIGDWLNAPVVIGAVLSMGLAYLLQARKSVRAKVAELDDEGK